MFFHDAAQFAGEASPSNLHLNSHWRYLPGNENLDEPKYVILDYIHHFLPRAKMIIIFRDPVDRFVPLRLHAHVISAEEIRCVFDDI